MTTVTRRSVLKGGTALVGGMAGILATGKAPAYAQAATVHWLRWTDFVPASDQLLRNEIAREAQKALGIKLNIETINANDIQARVTSAIQSGSGPDVVCVLNNWGQLYGESVVDVSDIAEALGKSGNAQVIDLYIDNNNANRAGYAVFEKGVASRSPVINSSAKQVTDQFLCCAESFSSTTFRILVRAITLPSSKSAAGRPANPPPLPQQ